MLNTVAHCYIPISKIPLLLDTKRNCSRLRPICARKPDTSETSQTEEPNLFSIRFSKALVAKSAVIVLGLGFIDAGYSGDWSQIGVVSKETEEVLKTAAYFVVPLCLVLVSFISDEEKSM